MFGNQKGHFKSGPKQWCQCVEPPASWASMTHQRWFHPSDWSACHWRSWPSSQSEWGIPGSWPFHRCFHPVPSASPEWQRYCLYPANSKYCIGLSCQNKTYWKCILMTYVKQRIVENSLQFFTSIIPPSCLDTSFWNFLLSRFSFPLAELRNVVTTVLMASSISTESKTRTERRKQFHIFDTCLSKIKTSIHLFVPRGDMCRTKGRWAQLHWIWPLKHMYFG